MKLKILLALLLPALAYGGKPTVEYPWMTKKQFQKEKRKAKARAKRKISSAQDITDDALSRDVKMFRALLIGAQSQKEKAAYQKHFASKSLKACSDFNGLKSKQEFDACLDYLDEHYETFDDDLKFFAAQLIPLRAFQGFAYKLYDLVKEEKVTHSIILTSVLRIGAAMRVNLPTEQWEHAFRYFTEPMNSDEVKFQKTI